MNRRGIQALIVQRELSSAVRRGAAGTADDDIPILVVLANAIGSLSPKKAIESLVQFAETGEALSVVDADVARLLYGLTAETRSQSVNDRTSIICNKYRYTEDNFNRRIKPKIIDEMANFLGSQFNFINFQNVDDMDNSIVTEELKTKLDAYEFLTNNVDRICKSYYYKVQLRDRGDHYECETDYERLRRFPETQKFKIYICRTYEGMQKAVADAALIGLECAELYQFAWS